MIAAEGRHHHLVEFLLVSGADVNKADKQGQTALMYAVMANPSKPRVVKAILAQQHDIDQQDKQGRSALMLVLSSALGADPVVVDQLVAAGADSRLAAEQLQQQIAAAEVADDAALLNKLTLLKKAMTPRSVIAAD